MTSTNLQQWALDLLSNKAEEAPSNAMSNEYVTLFGTWSQKELDSFINTAEFVGPKLILKCIQPTTGLAPAVRFYNVTNGESLKKQFDGDQRVVNVCGSLPTLAEPGLLVMDMDSTAIQIECIDEIAKLAGVGEQVAEVTAKAMRGELDFAESLHARVATLKGASTSIIEQVANDLPLMPGLEALVSELQKHNWKIAIVSGGFTAMTEALKHQLGLDRTIANNLDMDNGRLTGTVSGAVVDAQAKADAVVSLAAEFDIPMTQTIAMGDGANDLLMMAKAQLGVAFHAKPVVREQADISVREGGLDQLLYFVR